MGPTQVRHLGSLLSLKWHSRTGDTATVQFSLNLNEEFRVQTLPTYFPGHGSEKLTNMAAALCASNLILKKA